MNKIYYSAKEIAEMLDVSKTFAYSMIWVSKHIVYNIPFTYVP